MGRLTAPVARAPEEGVRPLPAVTSCIAGLVRVQLSAYLRISHQGEDGHASPRFRMPRRSARRPATAVRDQTPASSSGPSDLPHSQNEDVAVAAARIVEERGLSDVSAGYAGVYLADGRVVVRALTQQGAVRLTHSLDPNLIVFRQAEQLLEILRQRSENVAGQADSLALSGGITITNYGIDREANTLYVGVVNNSERKTAQVRALLGQDVIVQDAEPGQYLSRLDDSAPWNGGDFITDGGVTCTSGPPVVSNVTGKNYLLTAGHCFAGGTSVLNGTPEYPVSGTRTRVGGVSSRDWAPNSIDSELIDTSQNGGSSRLVWRGGGWTSNTQYRAYQSGGEQALQGQHVCASGAFEGETCNLLVTTGSGEACAGPSYSRSCKQDRAQIDPVSLTSVVGEGDSGGPVYIRQNDGRVYSVGTISSSGGNIVPCRVLPAKRTCYNAFYFTDMGWIRAKWNVSVKVS